MNIVLDKILLDATKAIKQLDLMEAACRVNHTEKRIECGDILRGILNTIKQDTQDEIEQINKVSEDVFQRFMRNLESAADELDGVQL